MSQLAIFIDGGYIDLVSLSTKRVITDAAIVAGDGDFVPAARMASDEGVSIWLIHGRSHHNALWDIADERLRLTQDIINQVLR
jgi:uncharacterized LabA/DUF88 family protein